MASYRDKINQRKMETESGRIAFAIELYKHYFKMWKEPRKTIDIYDGLYVVLNPEYWFVGKEDGEGAWFKVIPDGDYEVQVKVLDAQPWRYIG